MELIVGLVLFLGSTYGYLNSSSLIVQTQGLITGYTPQMFPKLSQGNVNTSMLQVDQSQMAMMEKVVQYGFLGLAICGFGALCYGIISKKQNYSAKRSQK